MVTGYNFSDNVRQVLIAARGHAGRLGHEYISPDHFALGIATVPDCVAAAALVELGVNLESFVKAVESQLEKGQHTPSGPALPYNSPAKRVLELAMAEARELEHSYVGTEHVLLGLLREASSGAAGALQEQHVTSDRLRPTIIRLLGSNRQSIVRGGFDAGAVAQWAPPRSRRALMIAVIALIVAVTALVVALF